MDTCGPAARERTKQRAVDMALRVARPLQGQVMADVSKSIQEASVADPDMWEILKPPIRRLIDMLFSDVEATLRTVEEDFHAQAKRSRAEMLEDAEHVHETLGKQGDKPSFPFGYFRAWLLYHWVPYDRSAFGLIKDPFWWLMLILSVLPGLPRILFSVVLLLCLCLGRAPDEYQIVNFILVFKGTSFISSGLFTGVYATVKYFWCVHPDGTQTCAGVPNADGPAASVPLLSSAIDLIGSCILVWTAFSILPYTVHHGYAKFIEDSDLEKARATEHGGHMGPLFGYDICCFCLTVILFCLMAYHDSDVVTNVDFVLDHPVHWHNFSFPVLLTDVTNVAAAAMTDVDLHRPFFFGKMFYALLSAPFVIFKLPLLDTLLSHTQQTGFNTWGNCVPYTLRPTPQSPQE